jgi:hypothetical protein
MTTTLPSTADRAARPGKTISSLLGAAAGPTGPTGPTGPAVRLAESPIWDRQRRFYAGEVPQIWGTATAPHAITANPRIAHSYARIAAEFLRSAQSGTTTDIPHFVEVGGGSGRFAYLFVRTLRALVPDQAFRYVLTDFCADRIDAWAGHARFQPLVTGGVLDFAVLDADEPGPIDLRISGRRLTEATLDAPVITIANYVVDTLRNDGFAIRAGELSELHLAIGDADPAADTVRGEWQTAPCRPLPPDLAPILEHYRDTLDDTTVLVPVGGLRVLDQIGSLTTAPSLALIADKGHCSRRELCGQDTPALVFHGSGFSVMVNFDLLARWVELRGGTAALPRDPARSLVVGAFVEGDPDGRLAHLPAFVHDQLLDVGPDNYFTLRPMLRADATALEQIVAVLRLSRFDPSALAELLPGLLDVLPEVPDDRRSEVERMLCRVADNWFDIGEPIDMALCLGLAFGALSRFGAAVRHLQRSIEAHPDSPDAALAMAAAQRGLRDLPTALRWTDRALELRPGLAEARALRAVLVDELGSER